MTDLRLEVVPDLWTTDDPDAFMVYAAVPEGGCVTLLYGTRAQCEAFAADPPADVLRKVAHSRA